MPESTQEITSSRIMGITSPVTTCIQVLTARQWVPAVRQPTSITLRVPLLAQHSAHLAKPENRNPFHNSQAAPLARRGQQPVEEAPVKRGLFFMINEEEARTGRPSGVLAWAGLANLYYWIDRRMASGILGDTDLPVRRRHVGPWLSRLREGGPRQRSRSV